jgi:leucyl aminopeptidase
MQARSIAITTSTDDIFASKADAIVLFTTEEPTQDELRLATKLGPTITTARARKEFEGKPKQLLLERHVGTPRFSLLVGLGKREKADAHTLRAAAAQAAESLRNLGASSIAFLLPSGIGVPAIEPGPAAQAIAEGALLRTYQYLAYRTQKLDEVKYVTSIAIHAMQEQAALARDGANQGQLLADACNMVRDLQNAPSCDMTPEIMAEAAQRLAKEEGLRCTILDKRQLQKQGYNGIASMGKGSTAEPRMVTLEYIPKNPGKSMKDLRTIALVGKGITFDTGGISIKPGPKMADMKFDMSGAANVLGIMRVASRRKLPIRIIGILCLAENMPDGGSYKPGDIVKTKSGKTIEIDNTDAEGRVVLADGLFHATTFTPELIIDMATLTGAAGVCLGDAAACIMGTDQAAIDKLRAAGDASGEKAWQLPLWDEYVEDIKSSYADVKNMGNGMAGTIIGGIFLKEFVGTTPWVHLDIASVAYAQGRERWFTPVGGTGFGVRLVSEFLKNC